MSTTEPRFKVGDEVTLTKKGRKALDPFHGPDRPETLVISSVVRDRNNTVSPRPNNPYPWETNPNYYNFGNFDIPVWDVFLKLVKAVPVPRFKVGDELRYKGPRTNDVGKTGIVASVIPQTVDPEYPNEPWAETPFYYLFEKLGSAWDYQLDLVKAAPETEQTITLTLTVSQATELHKEITIALANLKD